MPQKGKDFKVIRIHEDTYQRLIGRIHSYGVSLDDIVSNLLDEVEKQRS